MTDNNVVKMKEEAPALSPSQFLAEAIKGGASIEVIERMLAAQERWEAMQAKKAFNNAIAKFKANPPEILKTVEVGYDSRGGGSRTSYKHEDLAGVLDVVDRALAEHGLWVRFKTKVDDTSHRVTVTCVLGHADGYVEEDASTLSSAPDSSGNKNPIQALGSAVTYLQRYTLKPALGLAAANDDDGRAAGSATGSLSSEQVDNMNKALLAAGKAVNMDKFLQLAGAMSVSDIAAVKYDSAMQYIDRRVKDAKK
jgi:ERF superfamily protein